MLLGLLGQVATTRPASTDDWKLGGGPDFVMEATGRVSDPSGAALSLRSISSAVRGTGSVISRVSAEEFRGHRVILRGELLAGSGKGAGLLIRADAGAAVAVTLQNGLAGPVRIVDGWKTQSVSIAVPDDATVLAFGILLESEGSIAVRGLRLESGGRSAELPISNSATKLLDEAISTVRGNAIRRDSIDWKMVEAKARSLAGGAQEPSEIYPAIRWLLAQVMDPRSYFVPAAGAQRFWAGGGEGDSPSVLSLPDGLGYISVPGSSAGDLAAQRAYVSLVYTDLRSIAPVRCGFVIDLRASTEGNMWPMLSALRPFLGNTRLGTFGNPAGSSPSWLTIDPAGTMPHKPIEGLADTAVAVLTGPGTKNSGEALAIAFRGRPRTRTFGQPTAGFSGTNTNLLLSDGSMILLTTATMADRNGKRYAARIEPEEVIAAEGTLLDSDRTLSAAVRWLKQSPTCGATR